MSNPRSCAASKCRSHPARSPASDACRPRWAGPTAISTRSAPATSDGVFPIPTGATARSTPARPTRRRAGGRRRKTLRYLYDFGDGWEHSVRSSAWTDPMPGVLSPPDRGNRALPARRCRRTLGLRRVPRRARRSRTRASTPKCSNGWAESLIPTPPTPRPLPPTSKRSRNHGRRNRRQNASAPPDLRCSPEGYRTSSLRAERSNPHGVLWIASLCSQ